MTAKMTAMPTPPASTKTSLGQRLTAHARTHWPQLSRVEVRFRANFAYVDGHRANGETIRLCRLRYGGSASRWGFAIYRASHDDYEDNFLPNGQMAGSPEEALDCACALYITAGPSLPPDPSPTN
jgi:prepilin-type processing-associated H-X9-DG protein